MSYTIERLANYPAVVATLHKDFDVANELSPHLVELISVLDREKTPITVVSDARQLSISFDDLMEGTKLVMNGGVNANPVKHVNTRQYIIISSSALIKLSLNGFSKLGFGNLAVAESVEDVLKSLA